jgi:hypothetical protein
MRFAMISYSDSKQVLQMEGLGFIIDSSTITIRCAIIALLPMILRLSKVYW